MEWDTAAGQAVLEAAGGTVVDTDGKPLRYGKSEAGLRNPSFIAWGGEAADCAIRHPSRTAKGLYDHHLVTV